MAWLPCSGEEPRTDSPQPVRSARNFDSGKFLKTYCIDCHTVDSPSGDREFETLDLSNTQLDTQLALQEIIDQLTLSTMPPEDGEQPSTKDRVAAIHSLTDQLAVMRQKTKSTGGKTVLRRLSRREYRNTVRDLLAINMSMFDPTVEFPRDNLEDHFDNIGNTLVTSGHLLERYLNAADLCVEKALGITEKPITHQWQFKGDFYQQPELATAHRRAFKNRFLCLYDHPWNDKPEGAYGHIAEFKNGVPVDGVYEIRVHAKAMHRDTPYDQRAVRIDLKEEFRMGIRPGDTSIRDMVHTQPIQPKLAEATILGDQFRWYTFRVHLDRGFAPRFTFENGIHNVRGSFGKVYRYHKETLPASVRGDKGIAQQRASVIAHGKLPHIRIDEVHVQGPVDVQWPTETQRTLLGGTTFSNQNAESLIAAFASRVFRRPATKKELDDLIGFYHARIMTGMTAFQAFKDTLKAALCSPGFLYFQQPDNGVSGHISDHALAERLAYFLTSSMPDDKLRELADRSVLSQPNVLRGEVRRLLSSKASDEFIADFLDSWLDLRSLGSMPPDPNAFSFYYAANLQSDTKTETRHFLRDLIGRNASATEILNGNYSFINRDLAKLYGVIEQVPPDDPVRFRRVTFENRLRGGLLGQASVLTVSANGIETSPVVRGVWLLENILGTPTPPPPDDVPAIEPDTRGAKSIREQLVKHRESEACYQCHRKIDPLGFAWESFDAIGQERKFYDKRRKLAIDTSGLMPGGKRFSGLAELKQQLIARKKFFVRTLTARLLTHALGRRMEPLDRAGIESILAKVERDDYPMATLIEEVASSEIFRR